MTPFAVIEGQQVTYPKAGSDTKQASLDLPLFSQLE
jgi:hypothetical protein